MKSTVTLNIGLENNCMSETPNLWFQIYRMLEIHSEISGKDVGNVQIRQTVATYGGHPERTLIVRFETSSITTDYVEDLARRFADAMTQECVAWQIRTPYFDTESGLTYQTGWEDLEFEFNAEFFEVYESQIDG